ncbi:hypothetical protein ACIQFP_09790 [Nocardiopsis alba]|uniref:hypothetical protein n=1 Tax=Nocardiopsis alba TaxID=53437 RepID=UPI0038158CBC
MSVPSPSHRTIDSLARAVVADQAPDELPYYPNIRDDFFARGGRPFSSRDNPLGFGEVVLGMVAGVVLAVLKDLVVGSLTDAARPWWRRVWARVRLWVSRRSSRVSAATELPASTEYLLPTVREAVRRHGDQVGLPSEKREELVQAIIAVLTACADDAPSVE